MLHLNLSSDQRLTVLCLGAHADDIEIGCGGTLLRLAQMYPQLACHWQVFSADGPRADEARASAAHFLEHAYEQHVAVHGFRDGFFPYDGIAIKEAFERIKATVQPDLIFTHHRHDAHQDHRLLAELTWNTFRDHLIFEYEIPKYDGDLGLPNCFVSLEEAICQAKIDALLEHFPTQRQKHWFTADTFWALLRLRGLEAHSPTRFAEAFHCRKMVL